MEDVKEDATETQRCLWDGVPNELTLQIFSYLQDDRVSLSIVCRHFNEMRWANMKRISLRPDKSKQIKGDMLKNLLKKCRRVEWLELSYSPATDTDLTALPSCNCFLRILNLAECQVSDKGLRYLLSISDRFEILNVAGCVRLAGTALEKAIVNAKDNLQHLHTLNLEGIWSLQDGNIKQIVSATVLPSLKYLNVGGTAMSDRGLKAIIETTHERLKSLSAGNCVSLTAGGLASLSRMSHLWELNLDFLPQLTDSCLQKILEGCKSLREISLCGCDSLGSNAGAALHDLPYQGRRFHTVHVSLHSRLCTYLKSHIGDELRLIIHK